MGDHNYLNPAIQPERAPYLWQFLSGNDHGSAVGLFMFPCYASSGDIVVDLEGLSVLEHRCPRLKVTRSCRSSRRGGRRKVKDATDG